MGGQEGNKNEVGGRREGLEEEEGREKKRKERRMGRINKRVRKVQREEGESIEAKIAFSNVAGLGNKDGDFWKGIKNWDVVVMAETWMEKRGCDRIKERMTRGFRWEVQLVSRRSKKGRAIGGMAIEIRNDRSDRGSGRKGYRGDNEKKLLRLERKNGELGCMRMGM